MKVIVISMVLFFATISLTPVARHPYSVFGIPSSAFAAEETYTGKGVVGIAYFQSIFGHVHQNASRFSTSLTAISCGHPVKILATKDNDPNNKWRLVQVGPYQGYIMEEYISTQKPDCFQDRYPKFFEHFDLDLSELYYWGRLYDQYIQGKSRVR